MKQLRLLAIPISLFGLVGLLVLLSHPGKVTCTCGYESCPAGKPDMLNVHIICHTHNDVGWVSTVDNYYLTSVRDIIRSVITHLLVNETRKFIYVETAFFSRWWDEQSPLVKDHVSRLVNEGRLEFISGGWSMNDEATAHYLDIIDQMTIGLRWLNNTFGSCAVPKTGWQIDPFGHSREQASLFAQMYFDSLFLGRIHYQDKITREQTKNMEFVWKASSNLGKASNMFTGILPNVYWPPRGFCYDLYCADEEFSETNGGMIAQRFITTAEEQAKHYATNHIVMTMGMDFHYRDAGKWYRNLDALIQEVNSLQQVGSNVNVFYSTPSCYTRALNNVNKTWSTMTDDFFPYEDNPHMYWTGYFTSRPSLKDQIRKTSAFLQTCKQLVALSQVENVQVDTLQKAQGVLQHHDGVTGTEKQHVAYDYARQLSEGVADCEDAINKAYRQLLATDEIEVQDHEFCHMLNVSQCSFTENEPRFWLVVYNPLARRVSTYARLPVRGEGYRVVNTNGNHVPLQVVPIPHPVLLLPERTSRARQEIVFKVTAPPMGISYYQVGILNDYHPVNDEGSEVIAATVQDTMIGNEFLQLSINGQTGLLKEIRLEDGEEIPLRQSFFWYEGVPGYRLERASGAYLFNPYYDVAYPLAENVTYRVVKGPLVEEVHQYFTPWISQVIRVYRGKRYVEFDWVVGPIPVHDNVGKEVITRFDTNLASNETFYTDSNGRETMKRVRNFRPTYRVNMTEPISGNYFPVNSWITIKDEHRNLQMTIIPDRPQGGSSITDGSLELMVHRRLLFDDGLGVNEALNEPGVDGRGLIVRGKHVLLFGTVESVTRQHRDMAHKVYHPPMFTFLRDNSSTEHQDDYYVPEFIAEPQFSGLKSALPPNVHLLTLEKLEGPKMLLRLEHIYEKDEDPELSKPVNVSLTNMFTPFRIVTVRETVLSANQYLDEACRLEWRTESAEETYNDEDRTDDIVQMSNELIEEEDIEIPQDEENEVEVDEEPRTTTESHQGEQEFVVHLGPMEIRSFIVEVDSSW